MAAHELASTSLKLQNAGVSQVHVAELAALPVGAIDWKHILDLVLQYGPTVIAWLLFLMGKGPQPTTPNPIPPAG